MRMLRQKPSCQLLGKQMLLLTNNLASFRTATRTFMRQFRTFSANVYCLLALDIHKKVSDRSRQ